MYMHQLRNTFIALAALMLLPMSAVAAETLAVQPFSEYGIVDNGAQEGTLIISDTIFHLSDKVGVQKLNGQSASAADLKPGTKVGFNIYGSRDAWHISDIWILPGSYDPTKTGPVALPGSGPRE